MTNFYGSKLRAAQAHSTERPPTIDPHSEPWALSDAKARLSELVDAAATRPQVIARHGKPAAVVVDYDAYIAACLPRQSLLEYLLNSPLRGSELDIDRLTSAPRDVDV